MLFWPGTPSAAASTIAVFVEQPDDSVPIFELGWFIRIVHFDVVHFDEGIGILGRWNSSVGILGTEARDSRSCRSSGVKPKAGLSALGSV